MKQQFNGTYTFTPSTGVVTLNSIDLPLERLYLIVNTTRNTPLFNFAVSGLGATRTFNSGNTSFDVAFDTSSHSSTDRLAIIYDDGVLEGAATQPVSVSQTVSIFGEKFKTLANWSWPVSGHSPTLTVGGLEGRILRITGDWNGDGAPKTYRVVRVVAPNISIVDVEVQQWATGVVIPAGTGTGAGDFYFRVPSELNAQRQLQLLKVSGDNLGTAQATVSLYEESDTLNQGYSAVMSRPLTDRQLRATPVPVSAGSESLNCRTMIVSSQGSTNPVLVPTVNDAIATTSRCLLVKNVNMIRGSGDIFVEERRPDICATGEWIGLFRGNAATIYTAQSSSRRMRVNQILFNWMYGGSQSYDLYGEFIFQWFNSSGTFQAELLRVKKFTSGNLHTLNFPNGFIAPTAGGSIRVYREIWGDPSSTINLHWNISLWEE